MRIVTTGQVDRIIWWKGTDTMASDTFDTAILIVKRNEKATRIRFSRVPSCVSLMAPKPNMAKQPMLVAEAWHAVSSHGSFACRSSVVHPVHKCPHMIWRTFPKTDLLERVRNRLRKK